MIKILLENFLNALKFKNFAKIFSHHVSEEDKVF